MKKFLKFARLLLHECTNNHIFPKHASWRKPLSSCGIRAITVKCTPGSLGLLGFIGLNKKKPADNLDGGNKGTEWDLEKDINKFINSAETAINAGNLKKAETILSQALVHHEKSNTVGVTCVYDMLATVAYQSGDMEKSKQLIEKVIHYMTASGLPQDHNHVVSFRLKLARLLSKQGKVDEADGHFRQCLEIQKLKHQVGLKDEEASKLRINCLFWYGKHLVDNKKFQEAKYCFDTAYTLTARVKSLESSQVMVILYNYSDTLLALGEKDKALQHLLNAVVLGQLTNSPDLPHYYVKLGLVYMSKEMIKEARHWCESGKDSAKKQNNKIAQEEGENCINQINEVLNLGPLKI